jgi:hypothetical protein
MYSTDWYLWRTPTNARIEKARARRNKNLDRAGFFCPHFLSMHWTVVRPEATGTLPNPPAEIIEVIVRGYR